MPKATIERLHRAFSYDEEKGVLRRLEYGPGAKSNIGDVVGTINFEGYLTVYVDKEKLLVHRVVWAMHYGKWPSTMLDHINMNRQDNQISNLRLATHSQNQHNTKARSNTGRKGVVRLQSGKFHAQIMMDGKQKYLGSFDELDEAAHAYNKKAVELRGDFAVLNPIGQDYSTTPSPKGQP